MFPAVIESQHAQPGRYRSGDRDPLVHLERGGFEYEQLDGESVALVLGAEVASTGDRSVECRAALDQLGDSFIERAFDIVVHQRIRPAEFRGRRTDPAEDLARIVIPLPADDPEIAERRPATGFEWRDEGTVLVTLDLGQTLGADGFGVAELAPARRSEQGDDEHASENQLPGEFMHSRSVTTVQLAGHGRDDIAGPVPRRGRCACLGVSRLEPMAEAVLLDFYGTVVHEDNVVLDQICAAISRSATVQVPPEEIGRHLWALFSAACSRSHGEDFQPQRRLELASLRQTIEHFGADCNAEELAEPLFADWERPPIFDDAIRFLDDIDIPVVVVSNIDRADIETAIEHHGLQLEHVVTSDDVRSYKPRPEPFMAGLAAVGCRAAQVLHVGDSLTSDVAGAHELGIPVAWVNRTGRPSPVGAEPTYTVPDLTDLVH
ncbi:MAG: HAD family hydrolase, partial [Actinomycetota bacterium]